MGVDLTFVVIVNNRISIYLCDDAVCDDNSRGSTCRGQVMLEKCAFDAGYGWDFGDVMGGRVGRFVY